MSFEPHATRGGVALAEPPARPKRAKRPRTAAAQTSLLARGEPMLWLTGGALALAMCMIAGLVLLIVVNGAGTFWPREVLQLRTADGKVRLGELNDAENYKPGEEVLAALSPELAAKAKEEADGHGGLLHRRSLRTENYDLTGEHYRWIDDVQVVEESRPQWAVVAERLHDGRFYGFFKSLSVDGKPIASEPEAVWNEFRARHGQSRSRRAQSDRLEREAVGAANAAQEKARLAVRQAELSYGKDAPQVAAAQEKYQAVKAEAAERIAELQKNIDALRSENQRSKISLQTADGQEVTLPLDEIVRAYPANKLGFGGKLGVYASRWWEFLSDEPRNANNEGGVFPAIFGTVVMTLLMSMAVVPFGVLAALYLREYAKKGFIVSVVRVAINNLAGVPSIVFGVFGLGFFCYLVGGQIDATFYEANLPNPTFGKGALVWASLTLALMTLPVVIVSTEEALAAVPNSMREGSYACGASKWQTIWRIVLPRALPGIMTGMILAMARGAGEVAPLMLVGAAKIAPELPFAWTPPFGANRSFLHLAFHVFDLGFQSQNSDAAKPMVFTTTLLLIVLIATLNVTAVWLRGRLRRRYVSAKF